LRGVGHSPFGSLGSLFRSPLDDVRHVRSLFDSWPQAMNRMGRDFNWNTPIDITEHENEYTVAADLPGLKKEDIKIEVDEDDTLIISGERKVERKSEQQPSGEAPAEGKEGEKKAEPVAESGEQQQSQPSKQEAQRSHWTERSFGRFVRAIKLPNIDADKIQAQYQDGVLKLTVPKKQEVKPQRKQVTVA